MALGLRVSINTDDPSISDTTLTDEYWVAMSAMRITLEQIKHTIVTAAEVSFQPREDRERMAAWFRRELQLDDDARRPDDG
jgi:adenosine deaminase